MKVGCGLLCRVGLLADTQQAKGEAAQRSGPTTDPETALTGAFTTLAGHMLAHASWHPHRKLHLTFVCLCRSRGMLQ